MAEEAIDHAMEAAAAMEEPVNIPVTITGSGYKLPEYPQGFYENIPEEDYHDVDAASSSRLRELLKSPAHLKYMVENPMDSTDAMIIGSAIHKMVLEPKKFDQYFAILPEGLDKRTKVGKDLYNQMVARYPHHEFISAAAGVLCEGVRESIMDHAVARELIEAWGRTELSLFWTDPDTKLYCKGRPDRHIIYQDQLTVVDLKTTTDASPDGFSKSILNWGYHIQAAFYLDGSAHVFEDSHTNFIFIAVEKTPPYAVGVYTLDDEAIRLGRSEYKRMLALYKECIENKAWPPYTVDLQSISLPKWAFY